MKRNIIIVSVIIIALAMVWYSNDKKECLGLVNKEKINGERIKNGLFDDEKKYETFSINYDSNDFKKLPVNYTAATYAYDTSSPEKATGVADYVFIGKINKILRTEYRHPTQVVKEGQEVTVYDPYTIYSVDVIKNIKGNLTKKSSIELIQHGGLMSDKQSYSFMEGMDYLYENNYYIFLTYTASDGRMGISCRTSAVLLGELSKEDLTILENPENIKLLPTDALFTSNNEKGNSERELFDIIDTYIDASKKHTVPEGKEVKKSKIYDMKTNEK